MRARNSKQKAPVKIRAGWNLPYVFIAEREIAQGAYHET
jgi:hypothetical protein